MLKEGDAFRVISAARALNRRTIMGRLVLSRKPGERVALDVRGLRLWVTVDMSDHNHIRLIIDAPREVVITREELLAEAEDDAVRRADRG